MCEKIENELNEWLIKIAENGPHEEIVDHIRRYATDHIKREPFDDWIDSMLNMCVIYNIMNNRETKSLQNRLIRLQEYKEKHSSKI